MLQVSLEALFVHTRQISTETFSGDGVHGCVEVGPLVATVNGIRWAKTFGAVASSMPVDQSEARLVEGQNLRRFRRFQRFRWFA
jgi:hypothetical protein